MQNNKAATFDYAPSRGRCQIKWTVFYMIGTSIMKEFKLSLKVLR